MQTIMELIIKYIDNIGNGVPIFTNNIHDYVLNEIKDANPLVINEYINRYEKNNNNFVRFKKGIYYKCIDTFFGKTKIKQSELIKKLYLEDNGDVYGYETGPSFINRMGLTTQVPKYTYFATNKNRVEKCSNTIELVKPVVKVTKKNFKYLQILDVISNKYNIPFEVNNPNEIIRNVIDDNDLDFEKLLYYATFYKDSGIFKKIANLARGEN